ncbi:e9imm peptide [Streptomyces sp. NPDC050095]|uniref:e9imm peptide n=1 Tax=unclassified Streptomyces TaxID=2593676 RepID=UPI00342E0732
MPTADPDDAPLSHAQAVALVRRVLSADGTEEEIDAWLRRLDRSLGCPTGYVSDLVFWPPEGELTPEEVVARALAHRPFAL